MGRLQTAIFSLTLFLSAGLMFGLQPMIGKMLLPLVGGAPAGWVVAMAFFQVMLLGGYFLAHALSRLTPRRQTVAYLLCLAAGCAFLPVSLAHQGQMLGVSPGAVDVFLLLTVVVAVPFVALSATSSTLQRLFTVSGHASAHDPYFLYAASNLGSFAGLLAYPFYVEPVWTLGAQAVGWTAGYAALAAMTLVCLMTVKRTVDDKEAPVAPAPPLPAARQLEWMAAAFVPSALLCAVTGHITTDIASMPLLWVVPLGLYLLTFVIAFARRQVVAYEKVQAWQPVAVAVGIGLTLVLSTTVALSWYAVVLHLIGFFVIALMCHMRLARARPQEDARAHLTRFYLMLSLGGALGGVLVAFVAPVIFDRMVEYPMLLALSGLLNPRFRTAISVRNIETLLAAVACLAVFIVLRLQDDVSESWQGAFWIASLALVTLHPKLSVVFGVGVWAIITASVWMTPDTLFARSFYGVVKVYDRASAYGSVSTPLRVRYMAHGTTLHGYQILDPAYDATPTSYYTYEGPLGDIVNWTQPKNVAAIGLGTGTLNCYARNGRRVTFFEIDPVVVSMARTYFTYLSHCGDGKAPEIVLGDGRLELARLEGDRRFDLIVLDAFSSDSVPVHLLTREAVEAYLSRLTPRGVILFHISNRFFELETPLAAVAASLGLESIAVYQPSAMISFYAEVSKWVAVAPPGVLPAETLAKTGWAPAAAPAGTRVWTDDYSDLVDYLRLPAIWPFSRQK